MMRFLLSLIIASFLFFIAMFRTDGFSPNKIQPYLLNQEEIAPSDRVRQILSQPFYYLSKGRQSFVFESEDGNYVIKFFNQNYLQMPWHSFFSLQFQKEKKKRKKRCYFYEHSYALAKDFFDEKILYLHQSLAKDLPSLTLIDRASRRFILDLNATPFVLQRKGTLIYEALRNCYESDGLQGLCREIDQFFLALDQRIKKKIADADSDIEHNWGYTDGNLFHLDPGRLYYDPTLDQTERIEKEYHSGSRKFYKWIQKNYPHAAQYFKKRLFQSIHLNQRKHESRN